MLKRNPFSQHWKSNHLWRTQMNLCSTDASSNQGLGSGGHKNAIAINVSISSPPYFVSHPFVFTLYFSSKHVTNLAPAVEKEERSSFTSSVAFGGKNCLSCFATRFFWTSLHACHELHVSWTRLPQCRIHNLAQQGLSKTKCWNSHSADLTALFTALRTYLNRKGCANESSPRYFSWFEARFRRCWIDMMACSLSMKSGQKPTIFHFESKLVQFCLASSFISKRKKHYFVGFLCTFVRQWVSPGTCLENQK